MFVVSSSIVVVVVGNKDDNDDNEGAINGVGTTPAFIHPCHRYRHSCWSYSHSNSLGIRPATATIRVVLCSHVAPSTAADGIIIIMSFVQQLFDSTDVLLLLLFQFVSLDVLFFVSYCRFCFTVLIVIVVTVIFSLSSSWSYSMYCTTIIVIVFCVFYYNYTNVLLCVLLLFS